MSDCTIWCFLPHKPESRTPERRDRHAPQPGARRSRARQLPRIVWRRTKEVVAHAPEGRVRLSVKRSPSASSASSASVTIAIVFRRMLLRVLCAKRGGGRGDPYGQRCAKENDGGGEIRDRYERRCLARSRLCCLITVATAIAEPNEALPVLDQEGAGRTHQRRRIHAVSAQHGCVGSETRRGRGGR